MRLVQLAALVAGVLCAYSLFFSAAEDQKLLDADDKLRSKLQDWWDRIDATRNRSMSAHVRFMRGVADLTTAGFDRLFGKKLLSVQAVGVSACFKIASVCLGSLTAVLLAEYALGMQTNTPARLLRSGFIMGAIFLSLGSTPLVIRKRERMRIWFAILAFLGTAVFTTFCAASQLIAAGEARSGTPHNPDIILLKMLGVALGAAVIGVGLDTIFVAAMRRLLRPGANPESFFHILSSVFLSVLLGLAALVGPLVGVSAWHTYVGHLHGAFFLMALLASMSNLLTALAAAVFVMLAVTLLLHRMAYPFLQRPLSKLARMGVLKHKKIALCLAIYFLTYGMRLFGITLTVPDVVKGIVGGFTGG